MLELLLILLVALIYVPIYTLSTVFLVKGYTHISSILSFFEVLINVYGLSIVFGGHKTFIAIVIYALGSALGLEIGSFIESRIAVGYLAFEVLISDKDDNLINELIKNGFGVTIYSGRWKVEGGMYRLDILSKRKKESEVEEIILKHQPNAFIIKYEPYDIIGFRSRNIKKGILN